MAGLDPWSYDTAVRGRGSSRKDSDGWQSTVKRSNYAGQAFRNPLDHERVFDAFRLGRVDSRVENARQRRTSTHEKLRSASAPPASAQAAVSMSTDTPAPGTDPSLYSSFAAGVDDKI